MENSIAKMRPALVAEWSEKNMPITPDDVSYGSNKLYWWKGSCVMNGRQVQKQEQREKDVPSAPEQGS